MTLNLIVPQLAHTDFTPRITVIGVGGGGTNAVDNMIAANLKGVDFVVANTDAQQLVHSRADRRIQLGPHLTQGLGAGAKPEIGKAAAEEAADELLRHLDGAHMVFITAGMGGGTGTGAAPVIARMARERGILTVGVVTKPFSFEGKRRARAADEGIDELQQYVDTLIVIPNQNLFRMANERTTWKDAFKMADQVLFMGVRSVTDLMMVHGLINLDFADVKAVMAEMGKAMMGTGEADGDNRAIRAAESAINNPLLEDTSMGGAKGLLINITGGEDLTLFEVDQAVTRIREEVDEDANIIFGAAFDETLNGQIRVSVVATGIDSPHNAANKAPRLVAVGGATPEPHPIPTSGTAAVGNQSVPAHGPVQQLRSISTLREVPDIGSPQPVYARADPAHPPIVPRAQVAQPALRPATPPPMPPQAQWQGPASGQPQQHSDATIRQAQRPTLFAEPGRPQPAAPVVMPAPPPVAAQTPPPRGPSIFMRATGMFRWRGAASQAAPRPTMVQHTESRIAPVATYENHEHEAEGQDINAVPNFLLRQQ